MTRKFCKPPNPPPHSLSFIADFLSDEPQPPVVNEALASLKGSVGSAAEGGRPERWQPICSGVLQLVKKDASSPPARILWQRLRGNATANNVSGHFSSFCRLWQKTAAQQILMTSSSHLLYSRLSCRFGSLQAPASLSCDALCILR